MALIAVSMDDVEEYVSTKDPARKLVQKPLGTTNEEGEDLFDLVEEIDWEQATVFELGPLDQRTYTRLVDSAMTVGQGTGIQVKTSQMNYETVRYGLKGWRNFNDAKGRPIKYLTDKVPQGSNTYTVVSDQSMSSLGHDLIKELSLKIKALSQVSVEQAKN